MFTTVTEVLTDSSTCEWCIILHSSRITCRSSYDDSIWKSTTLLEVLNESRYRRSLLTDGNIDTIYRLSCLIERLLVDDSINSDSRLTCLTVTDDKLTLTTTDRNHRVHSLDTSLQWLLNRLTIDNARSFTVEWHLK